MKTNIAALRWVRLAERIWPLLWQRAQAGKHRLPRHAKPVYEFAGDGRGDEFSIHVTKDFHWYFCAERGKVRRACKMSLSEALLLMARLEIPAGLWETAAKASGRGGASVRGGDRRDAEAGTRDARAPRKRFACLRPRG